MEEQQEPPAITVRQWEETLRALGTAIMRAERVDKFTKRAIALKTDAGVALNRAYVLVSMVQGRQIQAEQAATQESANV